MAFNTFDISSVHHQNSARIEVASLQDVRDRLETRVQERTLELLGANQKLLNEVHRRQRSEQVLLATRNHLKRLLAFCPVVIYSRNVGDVCGITFVSESIAQFGYDAHQLIADPEFWSKHIHPDDAPQAFIDLVNLVDEEQQNCEYRILHQDGTYRWIRDQRQVIYDQNHKPLEIIGSWQDISERKRIEHALAQEKELAQTTLQSIGDAVITTNAKGHVAYMNPAAIALTGWRLEEAWNRRLSEVFVTVDELTRTPVTPMMHQVLRAGETDSMPAQMLLIAREGNEYVIDESAALIRDREGQITGTVLVFRDVTKPRKLSRQLSWQATHDSLTGLINRQEFEQRVAQGIETAHTDEQIHVLCYLDLDQFKVVNDTCGHTAGDELLRQLATLLQQSVRQGDVVARLGGDEFGLLLHSCSLAQAEEITDKILMTIQTFRFIWQENIFKVGASIGLVVIDAQSRDMNQVLSAADVACYAAKDNGRNRVHVYQANDREVAQHRCEQEWIAQITRSLDQGQFQLYQQSIIPLSERRGLTAHIEILLRMVNDQGEIVPPMAFLPAAERYGLMPLIDRWVITAFLQHYQTLNGHSLVKDIEPGSTQEVTPLSKNSISCRYAINLSGASINDRQFLEFVKTSFAVYPDLAKQVCFEITETIAITNLVTASQFMEELKAFGCQFALDDFGSGMSSFNYLKHLPVDYLKIDGSFVRNILTSPVDSAMVECINKLGHLVGIKTIAEFVDSAAILEELKRLGVDYAQGYAISQPSPL